LQRKFIDKLKISKKFISYVTYEFFNDNCLESASALTYTTLLAIVPLITVTFFIAKQMPIFFDLWSEAEQFIFNNFVPTTGLELQKYLAEFVNHAGELTLFGTMFLFISALTLIYTIEMTFNRIWGLKSERGRIVSFLLYFGILISAPILMGISFAISTYLWTFTTTYFKSSSFDIFLRFVPFFLTWGCFTVLYKLIPNCKVVLRHALFGALIAALLFEIAKFFFAQYVSGINFNTLIYGTFATIPIFLFWIYISWLIVLYGAEITCSIGFYRFVANNANEWRFVQAYKWIAILWQASQEGEALSQSQLFKKEKMLTHTEPYAQLQELKNSGWIVTNHTGRYVLGKDLAKYTLYDFYLTLPWRLPDPEMLVDKINKGDQIIDLLYKELLELNFVIAKNLENTLKLEFTQYLKPLVKKIILLQRHLLHL